MGGILAQVAKAPLITRAHPSEAHLAPSRSLVPERTHKRRTGGACPIGTSGRREGGWNVQDYLPVFLYVR